MMQNMRGRAAQKEREGERGGEGKGHKRTGSTGQEEQKIIITALRFITVQKHF